MEIKTKFGINQEVFFIRENKVKCMLVGKIAVNVDDENVRVTYNFNFYEDFEGFRWEYENIPEDQIFKTKQELLNSL